MPALEDTPPAGARRTHAPARSARAGRQAPTRPAWQPLLSLAAAACLLWPAAGQAARLLAASPQGDVGVVRQVLLRFDAAVVAEGNPQQPAPYTLQCVGAAGGAPATPEGSARWLDGRRWAFDLRQPLPAGQRCTLTRNPGFTPLDGSPLQAPEQLRFATGAPQVLQVQPWPGSQIEEDQHFLLRTNGAVDPASLLSRVWCEVEGLSERIGVRVLTGPVRDAVLRAQGSERLAAGEQQLLLACQRPFPAGAGVRLVWGAGVAAAGQPTLQSRADQRFAWTVRERFTAEFSCERENAQSPCLPLRPMTLRFSAPVPRALALQVRLQPAGGAPVAPTVARDDTAQQFEQLVFAPPFAENARFTLTLPAGLQDDTGRALANAGSFPLAVATGGLPPLAKFAAAPFGIVEAGRDPASEALLPFTLRHVQADLAGASTSGQVRVKTLDPATPDATLLQWIGRLQRYHERSLTARQAGLPASQWTVTETETDARGRQRSVQRERRVGTRELSLLAGERDARRSELPQLATTTPRATEVLGLPLQRPGYHVVEIESRVLGASLLASKAPMYVRTGALVTNLGVHFKRGSSSSLVWVTSLDRGRPVAGAQVAVNDCRGQLLWSGSTDAAGVARIPRGFEEEFSYGDDEAAEAGAAGAPRKPRCLTDDGLFVTARTVGSAWTPGPGTGSSTGTAGGSSAAPGAAGGQVTDLGWVFSRWQRGIEPWRFNVPAGIGPGLGGESQRVAHTVFDRTLLRAGEVLSMKHFVRQPLTSGLAWPAAAALPDQLVITHVGSGAETVLPLAWPRGARATESRWPTPAGAALGLYEVSLRSSRAGGAQERLSAGSFRIEAFRVPLVDARLAAPGGEQVAPRELAFQAQINALAGGPMPGAPLKLSALLRPALPAFRGYEDHRFEPPQQPRAEAGPDSDPEREDTGDGARLVADKLAATTDAQGAARIVLKDLPALTGPAELSAELSFNDPNGEVQTVAQRLRLWPARVVVGVRARAWGLARGEAGVDVVVLDTRGQPLADRKVQVQARVQQVLSTRKRLVGGFYAYDNQRQVRDLGTVCSGSTDAQGRLACTAALDASGEVEFVARALDDAGRASEAAASVWMSNGGELWFAQDNDDRIDLLPEQRELQPGQTARLQVRMPFRQATALVTIERDGILDARVMQLSGRQPVIELPMPQLPAPGAAGPAGAAVSWAPNVTVTALVLRGRLREAPWWSAFTWGWRAPREWWQAFRHEGRDWRAPTALVDLAKPSFKLGVAQLDVGLADQRLDVAVSTDKTQYAVRETVQATVRVTHRGQPLAGAEVAFAAVDEGLLALQANGSWDALAALLRPRPWAVETATAQGELIGRRHFGRKALPPGGGGGRNPTRELFDTLLLWRGTVQLDARGEARIAVPLNDSLTSFRLVAIADHGGEPGTGADGQPTAPATPQRFGHGSASVRVSQDLQMLIGLPPLARQGDAFDAGFTLRNTTARAMSVRATLAGSAQGAGGSALPLPALQPQTVTLPPGAAQELRWRVQVPEQATRIQWQAEAVETGHGGSGGGGSAPGAASAAPGGPAGAARDRLSLVQAVQPAVPVRVWQASLQPLEGSVSAVFAPPAGALPGVGGVQASLQPSLTGALPGLRRFFAEYPYTCLEQSTSRAIGLRDAAAWRALAAELPAFLDSDGLAQYFRPPPGSAPRGSDKLTAYLLSAAHEAGWAWPEAQREAMLRGLAAFVEGRLERRFNSPRADLEMRKLAALEALARHGRAQPRMLGALAFTPEAMAAWPTSSLLDAWSLLQRLPGAQSLPPGLARQADVQRLLRSRLTAGGSTLSFSTEAGDDWWWLMEGPDANAARLLLLASGDAAWKDDLPRLVNGTLARQRGGAWRTTTANLWGVLALERFAATQERVAVGGTSTLQWAAGSSGAGVASAAGGAGAAPGTPAAPGAGTARTAEPPDTPRRLDWQATPAGGALALLPWPQGGASGPGSPAAPAALVARHAGPGRPWLSLQALAAVPLQAPLAAGYRVTRSVVPVERKLPEAYSRGDVLRVRLQVEAAGDMAWVVLSDPVPTGAALLGGGLGRDSAIATRGQQPAGNGLLAYEERAAEAWRGYIEWLPRGTHTFEYTLRLNSSGRFLLPPTRVEAMYAPETFGEAPNAPLEVRP